ncbi:MAG TPA: hypothetical protein ENH12_00190 [Proteobacteria bacterium]|nr:hypothetical protein [Pseudomonadota bacterium]
MIITILFIIGSYFLAIFPAGWLINRLLKGFDIGDLQDGGLQNAGKYIGFLERFLIVTFVWSGELSAIGLLIAAKSIFRFGEIKDKEDRKLAEYILIGTFLSYSLALAASFTCKWILALILSGK